MYTQEIDECRRRMRLRDSLLTLLYHNPDFAAVFSDGLLHDEVLKQSLAINTNESVTVEFLKAIAVLKTYLDKVLAEGEQAQVDLLNYMNLIQDAR